jgi:hypothetical protein
MLKGPVAVLFPCRNSIISYRCQHVKRFKRNILNSPGPYANGRLRGTEKCFQEKYLGKYEKYFGDQKNTCISTLKRCYNQGAGILRRKTE